MSNQMLSPVVRIVDDDASVCESQSFFLQLAGFRTRSFSSAEDFLRMMMQRPPAVSFLTFAWAE